mmetsp:Transcript_9540/g.21158  ORF Transcript_9540/g.21158 Transcript_9540/m.21158 type:complete len:265 (+) Transcript_9540:284-1078(+)
MLSLAALALLAMVRTMRVFLFTRPWDPPHGPAVEGNQRQIRTQLQALLHPCHLLGSIRFIFAHDVLLDGANGFELCQVHGPPRGSPRAVRDLLLSLQRFVHLTNVTFPLVILAPSLTLSHIPIIQECNLTHGQRLLPVDVQGIEEFLGVALVAVDATVAAELFEGEAVGVVMIEDTKGRPYCAKLLPSPALVLAEGVTGFGVHLIQRQIAREIRVEGAPGARHVPRVAQLVTGRLELGPGHAVASILIQQMSPSFHKVAVVLLV